MRCRFATVCAKKRHANSLRTALPLKELAIAQCDSASERQDLDLFDARQLHYLGEHLLWHLAVHLNERDC